MALLRDSARPMYIQLKETIVADIGAGQYQPQQRLPSERELCQRYGVSRMTVRQALVELAREGTIYTRAGKGTFVATPSDAQPPASRGSFSQGVLAQGAQPSSRVLEATVIPAIPQIAQELQIAAGSDVILLVRVRLSDGEPLALETAFLPFALFPDLLRHDFSTASLHRALERDYQIALVQAEQSIAAALAEPREADALGLALPAAVLRVRRVLQRQDGLPVEFVIVAYRGDRYMPHAAL